MCPLLETFYEHEQDVFLTFMLTEVKHLVV